MLRKLAAITLGVSFIAMATSGMMMFVIEKPSFTIQMHPVHKLFGLLMVIAAIAHISYNFKPLMRHLKSKSMSIYGSVLVVVLVLMYGVVVNNSLPEDLAKTMDDAAAQAHDHE
jgi:hypothetical protein